MISAPLARYRVHLENQADLPEMFHMTAGRYQAAAQQFPALADRIDLSIGWDQDNFDAAIADADVLVGWNIPRKALEQKAPRLKLLHLAGAGLDHLAPLDWIPPGLTITNSSGIHAERVAEYIAMAVLALNARLPRYADDKVRRRWKPVFMPGVRGTTALVVGVGGLGEAGARRCKALGMHVIGVRPSGKPSPWVDEMVGPDRLMDVLPRADVALLTMPLTDKTRGLMGPRQLQAMKPGSGLINLARAGVLDHAALAQCLSAGHISGAFLDVASPEPPPADHPIWSLANTIITPHISCDDPDRYIIDALRVLFENLSRLDKGDALRNTVDPARGY
ncbi:MAG TPA: D-2-hydroxyacid dehydrogenase [Bordetella sp.]